ncbi:O-antigen ligase family protein [soil metagenome]
MSTTFATPRRVTPSYASLEFWRNAVLWLMVVSGFYVIAEPAPYEVLFAVAMILFLPSGGMRVSPALLPLVCFLVLYNVGGALGLVGALNDKYSVWFVIISFYMGAMGLFVSFIVAADPVARMETIRNGYIVAGFLAAIAGSLGYLNLFGLGPLLAGMGRAQGFFKDPNVYSTFLVPPFIFLAQDLLLRRTRHPIISTVAILVIAFALLVAFSRGAWVNVVVASAMLAGFTVLHAKTPGERSRVVIAAFAGAILVTLILVVALSVPEIQHMFQIRAAVLQSYDAGETGRFGNQINSLPYILTLPNGMNPRHFHYIFGEDPHNVYLNAFASYGWLGGVSFIVLTIMSFWAGWRAVMTRTPWQHHAVAVYCPLVSTMLQAVQIDIDHWRHFYLLIGATWGLMAASMLWQARQRLAAQGRLDGRSDWIRTSDP